MQNPFLGLGTREIIWEPFSTHPATADRIARVTKIGVAQNEDDGATGWAA